MNKTAVRIENEEIPGWTPCADWDGVERRRLQRMTAEDTARILAMLEADRDRLRFGKVS